MVLFYKTLCTVRETSMTEARRLFARFLNIILVASCVLGLLAAMPRLAFAGETKTIGKDVTYAIGDTILAGDTGVYLAPSSGSSFVLPANGSVEVTSADCKSEGGQYWRLFFSPNLTSSNNAGFSQNFLDVDVQPMDSGSTYVKVTSGSGTSSDPYKFLLYVVSVSGVTLDKTSTQVVGVDETVELKATISPDNATVKTVKWSVDNNSAVKLYSDAECKTEVPTTSTTALTVYAKGTGLGTATVSVKSYSNPDKSTSCNVRVKKNQTITASDVSGVAGETGKRIEASTDGDGTLSYDVKEGAEFVSVDDTGALTLKKAGTATITVTASQTNEYLAATKDVTVTVVEPAPTEYKVNVASEGSAGAGGTATANPTSGVTGTVVTLTATPNNNSEFDSWVLVAGEGATLKSNTLTIGTSDVSVKAIFKAKESPTNETPVNETPVKEATLTFDLAGGTLDGKTGTITITANVGDTINLPAAPTRDGYVFRCWKGSEYAAGAEYKVEADHAFTADWKDYPKPSMSNSVGGGFASTADVITYTVSQKVPDWASSLRTWVDLEPVLQFATDGTDIAPSTADGSAIDAKIAIDGQRLTVEVADAASLRGSELKFSYKAKLRSDAKLDSYLNAAGDTASVPYQAHTVFDDEQNREVTSTKESVKFKVGSSKGATTSNSTTKSTSTAANKTATLSRTADPTSFVAALVATAAGAAALAAGWRRYR